jgi:predicted glycosyltransferase
MAVRNKLRIAIYSQDGFGLGHLRRSTLISRILLEEAPDSAVLLFADSPVAPFFELPAGMDCVKLPSILKVDAGTWRPTSLPIDTADLQHLRAELLRRALMAYRPDLFLVDHMPGGVQAELIPALEAIRQERTTCRIVLGLRDILDAPLVTMRVWQDEGAYDALRRYYDAVLIYGTRAMFDTAATYRIPAMPAGIHYCGYVANGGPVESPDLVRQQIQAPRDRFVYVSAGGGADGYLLMRTYLGAIRHLGARADFGTVMAVGVNAPREKRQELIREAQGLPVQIVSYVEDSVSMIAAASLVVCMAGYNTLAEVLRFQQKALVVPRAGPSAEQQMRSRLFMEHGLIDTLHPDELSVQTLVEHLLADLDRDDYPSPDADVDTHGAPRAVDCLLQLATVDAYAGV